MAYGLQNVKTSRDEIAWEIEVRAEIPPEALARHREDALKELQKTAKLDGFRPGHAPVERIVEVYGEDAIAKRAIERAIQHELPELLAAENVLIIESPRVTIEPSTEGKSVNFTARAALAPRVTLPDYKAIARAQNAIKEEISVSDEEHAQAMAHLRRERARIHKLESGIEPQKAHEEARALKEEELPALDDAFVQSLGIENTETFSKRVRLDMQTEKEMQAREKRRAAILDELAKESTVNYPAQLREYELDDMEARMKADVERMGTTFDAYLAQAKKTREQVRAEWTEAADKRAKVRLILTEIARKEKIEPDAGSLTKELEHARKHVPTADPEALRMHIAHSLRNDATLRFLENIS